MLHDLSSEETDSYVLKTFGLSDTRYYGEQIYFGARIESPNEKYFLKPRIPKVLIRDSSGQLAHFTISEWEHIPDCCRGYILVPDRSRTNLRYLPPGEYTISFWTSYFVWPTDTASVTFHLKDQSLTILPYSTFTPQNSSESEIQMYVQRIKNPPNRDIEGRSKRDLFSEMARLSDTSLSLIRIQIEDRTDRINYRKWWYGEWSEIEDALLYHRPLDDKARLTKSEIISLLTHADWKTRIMMIRSLPHTRDSAIINAVIDNLTHPFTVFPHVMRYMAGDPSRRRPVQDASINYLRFLGNDALKEIIPALQKNEWTRKILLHSILVNLHDATIADAAAEILVSETNHSIRTICIKILRKDTRKYISLLEKISRGEDGLPSIPDKERKLQQGMALEAINRFRQDEN